MSGIFIAKLWPVYSFGEKTIDKGTNCSSYIIPEI